jgi:cytochrome c553
MKGWRTFLLSLLMVALFAAISTAPLIGRCFSAKSEPSAFEKTLTRSGRNLTILRAECNATNPWAATSENVQEAREDFITRCAICHGTDGSGQTQIGRSRYPRVPDLLSPPAQNISDGEIHHFIVRSATVVRCQPWTSGALEYWRI